MFVGALSATSKYSVLSICFYHALEGPKVQLLRRQQHIDKCFVWGCGMRCTDIKPVENLADQGPSIKTPTTEHMSNLEQSRLSSFNFESSEGILKDKSCVKILGASRWCLVHLNWTRHVHQRDAPKIFKHIKNRINMHERAHLCIFNTLHTQKDHSSRVQCYRLLFSRSAWYFLTYATSDLYLSPLLYFWDYFSSLLLYSSLRY